jgi:PAS domain S-box-containing protein
MRHETNTSDQRRPAANSLLVAEAAPLGMLLADQEGAMLFVNRHLEKLFGYGPGELTGQPVEVLVPERIKAGHPHNRAAFFAKPEARTMGLGRDLCGRRKDGSEVMVEVGLSPLDTDQGMLVLATVTDITERIHVARALEKRTEELKAQRRAALNLAEDANEARRRAELNEKALAEANEELVREIAQRRQAEEALRGIAAELARSNAELELFASVASHDLQEPLRMVSSYLELLAQRYQGQLDGKADRWIGFAVEGAVRMKRLINDLLEFSRVGTRGKPLEPTDCGPIFAAAVANLQHVIRETDALVTSGPLPTVYADATQMTQLLQNLIGNAIKYRSQKQPEVHVEARREGDDWLFSVRDNGIGIDPQFAERIFIIFQRLHTREEYSGTGIGLAICKKIVERHGGRIWVESQPGAGATFSFTIPEHKGANHGSL